MASRRTVLVVEGHSLAARALAALAERGDLGKGVVVETREAHETRGDARPPIELAMPRTLDLEHTYPGKDSQCFPGGPRPGRRSRRSERGR